MAAEEAAGPRGAGAWDAGSGSGAAGSPSWELREWRAHHEAPGAVTPAWVEDPAGRGRLWRTVEAPCPDMEGRQSRMKPIFLVLLAALLGVDQVPAVLMCFSCENQKSNYHCLKPTLCSSFDKYCVTETKSGGIGDLVNFGQTVTKGCSQTCPTTVNLGLVSVNRYCCKSFLCNYSAAGGGPKISTTVLGLGVLLSLLVALLRPGL
ncbi:PREDICTED: lymphocyte antigen 6E [Elephantulus edwardii]|uniref:lymphocyte antigen 6E n=1 Tax=Elephantulus edwardii TaxID=28737 RepID=UPI0003F0C59F|nr:PREDICTED: lymphocyte antigen 6E [Elephantulus edwardii]